MIIRRTVILIILFSLICSFLFAETGTLGTTSLNLSGVVAPKSLLGITQLLGAAPGLGDAIPLDSGDILYDAIGNGVEVGTWAASSNSSSSLELIIEYTPFVDPEITGVSIPYIVHNGIETIVSGGEFYPLVRTGGIYQSEDNSGSVFIKRTDTNTYPPSSNYRTTISFTLQAE
jgi:hypothetical protein